MSEVALRRAEAADIATLVAFRVRLQREARSEESDAGIQKRWHDFFSGGLRAGTIVPWIAEDDGKAVAVIFGFIRPYMPREGFANDCEARVHNVFVDAAYRRRGIGRRIVTALLDDLRSYGPYRIVLSPTDEARPLYASLGFKASTEMVLKL